MYDCRILNKGYGKRRPLFKFLFEVMKWVKRRNIRTLKSYLWGYGARQYGYDGWGMAELSAHSKWVSVVFMRGTDLEDPDGLLEGTGKNIRHVRLRSPNWE
jgi:hypothetical protein